MKMASIYIDKEEIAKKLGIETSQFVFGKVEGGLHEIQFEVIIDSNAKIRDVANTADVTDSHLNLRRQSLKNIGE